MNISHAGTALSADELEAITGFWRRERRELSTYFSGTSMLPAIAPGQAVVVECGIDPTVGDVAVFRISERIVVHRVVARTATWVLTWGDANSFPDDPVKPMQIIGTIRNVSAARRTVRRVILLQILTARLTAIDVLAHRVRLARRVRSAWAEGAFAFTMKVAGAMVRRHPRC
jgi:signal peptidase I